MLDLPKAFDSDSWKGSEFSIRILGDLPFFLGIQVKRVGDGIHIYQHEFLANLLQSTPLANLQPSKAPMEANVRTLITQSMVK